MSPKHNGSCLCAQVSFEIEGDFESFYLCHCQYCQKDTGSAHAANLFSTKAKLNFLSGIDQITSYQLPETRHRKSFCKKCGSALPSLQNKGALLVVPAGCLDSKLELKPQAHLFTASRASWDDSLETLKKFDRYPS